MIKRKKESGITLIALIITIIVLLILAGVSISMVVLKNGVIEKVIDSKDKTNRAYANERVYTEVDGSYDQSGEINLDYLNKNLRENLDDVKLKKEDGTYENLTEENRIEQLPVTVKYRGYDFYINEENNVDGDGTPTAGGLKPGDIATLTEKDNYTDPNGDTATIPAGFKVSEKENTIDDGLVVIGPDGSEFVWVPVPNAVSTNPEDKPMAKVSVNGEGHYQGVLYRFTASESFEGPRENETWGQDTSGYREPSLITSSPVTYRALYDENENIRGWDYDSLEAHYKDLLGYDSVQKFGKAMQDDYDNMISSVIKYKGFYVGRYEMSLEGANKTEVGTEMAQSKKDVQSLGSRSWYDLYKLAETYKTKENSVVSGMIWGSQWDAMLNWMQKTGINVTATDGYNDSSDGISGSVEADQINRVYDLKGCHYEIVVEHLIVGQRT